MDPRHPSTDLYDALVVGGGPAGLQAALTLGRMHRRTLLVDSGLVDSGLVDSAGYRNARVAEMHNVLGRDGTPPERLRADARAELAAYDAVTVLADRVTDLRVADPSRGAEADAGALAEVSAVLAGGREVRARALVLATGLRDELPPVPGLAGLWGTRAFGCPYCHGHELAGRRIGVLGGDAHRARLALHLARIGQVVWLVGDDEPDAAAVDQAVRAGVRLCHGRVRAVAAEGPDAPVRVEVAGAGEVEVDGLFVATTLHQAAPFAERLGLEVLASGGIAVDDFQRTSRVGVYAAGDLAHRRSLPMAMASVLAAAAAGQLAAATCDQDLLAAALTPR